MCVLPNGTLWADACDVTSFEMHKQQASKSAWHRPEPPSWHQPWAELFSNSPHWSLKVSTRHNRHPMTRGGGEQRSARGAISCSQEHWGSDRQSTQRARKKERNRGGDEGKVCMEGEGKDGHYPNGSLCPIYPSHAATFSPTPQEF